MNARVSVVIPCFNHGRFLADAIGSVLAQTLKPHEIIVVDDGSADETPGVAQSFAGVRYVRQENRGLAAARNTGLRNSSGEFIAFLDADDRFLPAALEAGASALEAHPECAFVYGGYRFLDEDGMRRPAPQREEIGSDAYAALLRTNVIAMHATVMYRRDVLDDAGGFDESLRACEDYELYLRLTRERKVNEHQAVVAEYRKHGGNMSGDPSMIARVAAEVLRKQFPFVRDDAVRLAAWRHGLRELPRWAAARWSERMRNAVRQRSWRGAASAAAHVLREPRWIAERLRGRWRRLRGRRIDFGSLRRLTPVSESFGFDRGLPIDRFYIEEFLGRHTTDIRGRVLEVGDDAYTRMFGGERVTRRDVLHVDASNPAATIVGDLARGDGIPSDAFDAIILTQTLHLLFDVKAAVETLYRITAPGGTVLATVPGITPISRDEWRTSWYWSLTPLSARALFEPLFGAANVSVEWHGNVLAATSFLQGIAAQELDERELRHHDPRYPMLIAIRARKT